MVTFSVWAVSGLSGLLFDLEPCYIANYGRYIGRLSLSTNIGEEQLKVIEDYMEQHDRTKIAATGRSICGTRWWARMQP